MTVRGWCIAGNYYRTRSSNDPHGHPAFRQAVGDTMERLGDGVPDSADENNGNVIKNARPALIAFVERLVRLRRLHSFVSHHDGVWHDKSGGWELRR